MKKQFLTETQNKRMTEIIADMIIRNIEAGATIEQAKDRTYNRIEKEYPEVLAAWIEDNLN